MQAVLRAAVPGTLDGRRRQPAPQRAVRSRSGDGARLNLREAGHPARAATWCCTCRCATRTRRAPRDRAASPGEGAGRRHRADCEVSSGRVASSSCACATRAASDRAAAELLSESAEAARPGHARAPGGRDPPGLLRCGNGPPALSRSCAKARRCRRSSRRCTRPPRARRRRAARAPWRARSTMRTRRDPASDLRSGSGCRRSTTAVRLLHDPPTDDAARRARAREAIRRGHA